MTRFVQLPQEQVSLLKSQAAGTGWRPVDFLAAAITQVQYGGAFALLLSERSHFEELIQETTVPEPD